MSSQHNFDEKTKIWSCEAMEPIFNKNKSIGEIAYFTIKNKPPHVICQTSDTENISLDYETLLHYAVRIGQHLKNIGLTQDDVVTIIAPNTSLLFPLIVGCWFNGTIFQPINPAHEVHVIKHLCGITKPKLIFCDGLLLEKIQEAFKDDVLPEVYTLCNPVDKVHQLQELLVPTETEKLYRPQPLKYGPSQTVGLACSSGTTGLPKAVRILNSAFFADLGVIDGSDVIFAFGTPDWITGLFSIVYTAIYGGLRIITTKPFSPEYLLELIPKYKITFIMLNSLIMGRAAKLPQYNRETMKSIRVILGGGISVSPEMLKVVREPLESGIFANCYGITEAGGIAINGTAYKLKSVGKVLPNVQLKVLHEETGEPLGPNDIGEICINVTGKWSGYYNNEKATMEALDADGWYHTGDLGYFDDEQYLFLVDRSKDIIKCKSMHVSPQDIEVTIAELPDVLDVCVFGIRDEILGDAPAAVVVKKEGSELTAEDVVEYVAKRQEAIHKHLHAGAIFVPTIERNVNQKVLRRKIKERYQREFIKNREK